ncbi:MAG: hypothetical protein HGGPFJEG_00391 [Ignavibacteria bacterium]|nr:hypothetical protein [Ignavibacteria bacterium]
MIKLICIACVRKHWQKLKTIHDPSHFILQNFNLILSKQNKTIMKKKFFNALCMHLFVFAIFSAATANDKIGSNLKNAEANLNQDRFTVWIYFTDKGPDANTIILNPMSFISRKSFERRLKVKSVMNAVDITDVPVYQNYVSEVSKIALRMRHKSKWLNAVSAELSKEAIFEIIKLPFVKKIELVERYAVKVKEEDLHLSEYISHQKFQTDDILADSLNYGTGNAVTQISIIKVNQVHNEGIFGQGILICDLDAGFSNLTHEAFTTLPMKIISTYDFENHTPVLTGHSHGTNTLSLVGGYKPGKLIGVSFASEFMLGRTEVAATETPSEMDNWIAGAEWADSLGADIITSSLGYLDFDPPYSSYTWNDMNGYTMPITNLADLAVNKGIVVCNSAGNNGNSSHNTLIGPADGDSVITVGAVTSSGTRSSFSSVGPSTDVPARIKPDVMAMGSSNYAASSSGNNYSTVSGTSFSCPMTAGVCGLILSANKNLTPIQVRNILRKFGSNTNSPNNTMGWGIIDAKKSADTARKLDVTPPEIKYTHQLNTVTNTNPVIIRCKITDNGIIRNRVNESPKLYYRKFIYNSWSAFSMIGYSSYSGDKYIFSIPGGDTKAIVEFYIASQDIALPVPLCTTLPAGGSGVNPPGSIAPVQRYSYKVAAVSSLISDKFNQEPEINCSPNPFNPSTSISYSLPQAGNVVLKVFDISGKAVKTLVNEFQSEGKYSVRFDGSSLSSGIYFYRLKSGDFIETKRMILIK